MEKPYHIVGKGNSEDLGRYLGKHGQGLLPMVELVEQSQLAIDELGRAQIEAVLRLSAERVAGAPHRGKKGGEIGWHGVSTRQYQAVLPEMAETVGVARSSVSR